VTFLISEENAMLKINSFEVEKIFKIKKSQALRMTTEKITGRGEKLWGGLVEELVRLPNKLCHFHPPCGTGQGHVTYPRRTPFPQA
jgi:hypothetical protein